MSFSFARSGRVIPCGRAEAHRRSPGRSAVEPASSKDLRFSLLLSWKPAIRLTFSLSDIRLHQSPVDEGVIHESLQYGHQGLVVLSEHAHRDFASPPKGAFNATDLK